MRNNILSPIDIKRIRATYNETQINFAKRLCISQRHLASLESGKQKPGFHLSKYIEYIGKGKRVSK